MPVLGRRKPCADARRTVSGDGSRCRPIRGGPVGGLPSGDENRSGESDRTPHRRRRSGARAAHRQCAPLCAAIPDGPRQSTLGRVRRRRDRALAHAERPAALGPRTADHVRLVDRARRAANPAPWSRPRTPPSSSRLSTAAAAARGVPLLWPTAADLQRNHLDYSSLSSASTASLVDLAHRLGARASSSAARPMRARPPAMRWSFLFQDRSSEFSGAAADGVNRAADTYAGLFAVSGSSAPVDIEVAGINDLRGLRAPPGLSRVAGVRHARGGRGLQRRHRAVPAGDARRCRGFAARARPERSVAADRRRRWRGPTLPIAPVMRRGSVAAPSSERRQFNQDPAGDTDCGHPDASSVHRHPGAIRRGGGVGRGRRLSRQALRLADPSRCGARSGGRQAVAGDGFRDAGGSFDSCRSG